MGTGLGVLGGKAAGAFGYDQACGFLAEPREPAIQDERPAVHGSDPLLKDPSVRRRILFRRRRPTAFALNVMGLSPRRP
jgi:hypothetical protein